MPRTQNSGQARRPLFQNRDHPVLNITRMYGLSSAQLDHVFGGVAPKDLALI